MTNDNSINILLIILAIITLFLYWIFIVEDAKDFRESSEGKCLIKVAKEYCDDNEMPFIKVYSPAYDDSFACYDIRNNRKKEIHFTTKELRDCA